MLGYFIFFIQTEMDNTPKPLIEHGYQMTCLFIRNRHISGIHASCTGGLHLESSPWELWSFPLEDVRGEECVLENLCKRMGNYLHAPKNRHLGTTTKKFLFPSVTSIVSVTRSIQRFILYPNICQYTDTCPRVRPYYPGGQLSGGQ